MSMFTAFEHPSNYQNKDLFKRVQDSIYEAREKKNTPVRMEPKREWAKWISDRTAQLSLLFAGASFLAEKTFKHAPDAFFYGTTEVKWKQLTLGSLSTSAEDLDISHLTRYAIALGLVTLVAARWLQLNPKNASDQAAITIRHLWSEYQNNTDNHLSSADHNLDALKQLKKEFPVEFERNYPNTKFWRPAATLQSKGHGEADLDKEQKLSLLSGYTKYQQLFKKSQSPFDSKQEVLFQKMLQDFADAGVAQHEEINEHIENLAGIYQQKQSKTLKENQRKTPSLSLQAVSTNAFVPKSRRAQMMSASAAEA